MTEAASSPTLATTAGGPVVVVEPYASLGGHHIRTASETPLVFTALGVPTKLITDNAPPTSPRMMALAEMAAGTVALGLRVLRRLVKLGTSRPEGHQPPDGWLSHYERQVRILGHELPPLLACRREARNLRRRGPAPLVVICSSYLRPFWLKPAIVGQTVVEQVFDEPDRPERVPLRRVRPHLAATTPRIATRLREMVPDAVTIVAAHHPLSEPPTAPQEGATVGADMADALQEWDARGAHWGLLFGVMHGKKDLATIVRSAPLLPEGIGIALVGDPAYEARHLPPDADRLLHNHPAIRAVLRPTTEEERLWLFERCAFVLVSQQRGISTMSGSLVDAIHAGRPVVATHDTACGDLTERIGLGAVHRAGDPSSLAEAVATLARSDFEVHPDRSALADAGFLAPAEWALRLLDLANDGVGIR